MIKGTLYLLPTVLGDVPPAQVLPQAVIDTARKLEYFFVENPKTARRFLASLNMDLPIQAIKLAELSEHTPYETMAELLIPLQAGKNAAILSEAGCPGVADPGAGLVELAHQQDIRVVPLVGPSSLLLALMGSGLDGQRFAFHGYLPINETEREKAIVNLENESGVRSQTQLFIETPYRNDRLFCALLSHCHPETRICIATDLTLPSEQIQTRTVREWKMVPPLQLNKRPSLFLLLARNSQRQAGRKK